MRSAVRARPGQPGDGLAGVELAGPCPSDAQRTERVADVTDHTDRFGPTVRFGQPRFDELTNGEIDVVVEHFGTGGGCRSHAIRREGRASGTRRHRRRRRRGRSRVPTAAERGRDVENRRRDRPSSIGSPRIARSCATNVARGPRSRWSTRSPHEWCCAATSVSGPIVKRPDSPSLSSSTAATYSGSASSARRYSASVAAGHSCRPVSTA